MSGSGYKLLGMVVWRGGKWYLRRTYGHLIPSRRAVALALVGAGGVGAALLIGRRAASS
jgi:hypothetical protein